MVAQEMISQWVHRHLAVYELFEEKLLEINPNLEEITSIDQLTSQSIIRQAVASFGWVPTYLFVVFNSVCLDASEISVLRKKAIEHRKTEELSVGLKDAASLPISISCKSPKPNRSRPAISPLGGIAMRVLPRSSSGIKQVFSPPSEIEFPSLHADRRRFMGRNSTSPDRPLRTSTSFVLPRSSDDYGKISDNSSQEGWLWKRSSSKSDQVAWKKRFVILRRDKVLYFKRTIPHHSSDDESDRMSIDPMEDSTMVHLIHKGLESDEISVNSPNFGFPMGIQKCGSIPLYLVKSIRSVPMGNDRTDTFQLELDVITRIFRFRCESLEELNRWLFGFQCAIAVTLNSILDSTIVENKMKILKLEKWWKKSRTIDRLLMSTSQGPVMDIDVTKSSWNSIQAVCASTIGHRPSMEDAHVLISEISSKFPNVPTVPRNIPCSFFGIFDGHGGHEAAEFSAKFLLQHVVESFHFPRDMRQALTDAYLKTDRDFILKAQVENLFSGTTAVTAFLFGNKLYVANCGDSRAVLGINGKAYPMSRDHKPNLTDERIRIEERGGWITSHQEINLSQLYCLSPELIEEMEIPQRMGSFVGFITIERVLGELTMTRAIGDREFKGNFAEIHWDHQFSGDIVIANPEVMEHDVMPSERQFLVLACDGLWDVMDSQGVVDFIEISMSSHGDAERTAVDLVHEAIAMGSMDNVSVAIVFFDTSDYGTQIHLS
eukprot:TRINITY_DN5735_c0_g1_i3.p1 TRINITY_DN5735_c0_g1~~TRINITY_DN5735_c0_g1_i3.p1  ORF type:complete len:716 (+),score=199.10 TRINITY_DN5735_c0_g1_i3:400-2547(+)